MQNKILERYKNTDNIEDLKERIIKSMTLKKLFFGNKITLAKLKTLNIIDDILNNEDNFLTCDICGKDYSLAEINRDFETVGDKICHNCQDNFYSFCNDCGEPVYMESDHVYILNDEVYCKNCYFDNKEDLITKTILKDKKLKAFNRLLNKKHIPVNYNNLKSYEFKIDGYGFSIEKYLTHYRLGSWTANYWADLCSYETNLLKAIQYLLKDKKITEIFKNE